MEKEFGNFYFTNVIVLAKNEFEAELTIEILDYPIYSPNFKEN